MDVAIVCVGDELLDGRIRDRNAPYLGSALERAGHRLVAARLVPDQPDAIVRCIEEAAARSDLVVVTGGLGPTCDDRTREAAARWAGDSLELREDLLDRLRHRFEQRGYTFTDNNRRQCYVPTGADVLPSDVGTASAFIVSDASTPTWFLPGVPREFHWYVDEHLLDRLDPETARPPSTSNLMFLGLGESSVETRLSGALEVAEQRDVSIRYIADSPTVDVRLRGPSDEDVGAVADAIRSEIGDWLVTADGESIPERVGRRLSERDATVATAESCTAGWISKCLTDVAGSSSWFEYGFVTYANAAKTDLLGVESALLEEHGAVSPDVVRAMADGAARRAGSEYGVAVSGIAGPTGGTEAKPVGTVEFGLATPRGIYRRRIQFPPRSRRSVRWSSVLTALGLLLWHLDGRLESHSVDGPSPPETTATTS